MSYQFLTAIPPRVENSLQKWEINGGFPILSPFFHD
jgi:hypothetical protein